MKAKQAKTRKPIICSCGFAYDGNKFLECPQKHSHEPSAAMSEASTPNFLRSSHTSECNDANDRSANEICLCDERSEYQMLKDHLAQSLKREERLQAVIEEMVKVLHHYLFLQCRDYSDATWRDANARAEQAIAKAESGGK
jgi:hypothetical protein